MDGKRAGCALYVTLGLDSASLLHIHRIAVRPFCSVCWCFDLVVAVVVGRPSSVEEDEDRKEGKRGRAKGRVTLVRQAEREKGEREVGPRLEMAVLFLLIVLVVILLMVWVSGLEQRGRTSA